MYKEENKCMKKEIHEEIHKERKNAEMHKERNV